MASGRTTTAWVNGTPVPVEPKETLLQAALRAGLELPSSCRVGGCGTCRCRLTEGRVKELTESAYLLTDAEAEQGYVLACQSVPLGDVRVEVDLSSRGASGAIVGQQRLTPELTRLTIQLEAPLPYAAGQFADLRVQGLDAVERSYSFATPSRPDGRVEFLVRRVPGGRLSTLIHDEPLLGRHVRLRGPFGEVRLPPGDAPLLFVAGGSGLAPVLAMLHEAVAAGIPRRATLLFGARELFALDELEALRASFPGELRVVPVLAEAPADGSWSGARGPVTGLLADHLEPGAHVIVCGPPAMVDAATATLSSLGVPRALVQGDRFAFRVEAGSTPPTRASPFDALHYLKYFLFHLVGLLSLAALLAGGASVTAGLLSILTLYMLGDALCGDDTTTPSFRFPAVLTAQLWLALPLLAAIVFAAVWSVSPGDPLGFGAWLSGLTGFDVTAARDATAMGHHLSGFVITGLMIGMVGTITAHELTHRTWDPISMAIGRWLLAFSFDTSFAIEHVYGHHRYVATDVDPATAPRGRNVYVHVVRSTIAGNVSAWHLERARLRRGRHALLSPRNAFLRGHAMSLLLVAAAWAMGGWRGAAFFTACGLWGKALLEIVNYMEHYGIVRSPETPVQPRHSWNTNRRISSWSMFNLTRHSHHHAQGEVPYHELRPMPDAPMMINGYLTTIVVAMIPPLWHRLMTPKVLAWDRTHATAGERALAARANARSGLRALREATPAAEG